MRRAAFIAIALIAAESEAAAEPVRDHPFYIAVVSIGGIGGLANSIGALVYAIDGRSFHAPWIATTVFSSAICGATAGQFIVDAANDEGKKGLLVTAIVGFIIMTVWPSAWVIRSALADVPLGSRFDSEVVPEATEDEEEAFRPRAIPLATTPIFSLAF